MASSFEVTIKYELKEHGENKVYLIKRVSPVDRITGREVMEILQSEGVQLAGMKIHFFNDEEKAYEKLEVDSVFKLFSEMRRTVQLLLQQTMAPLHMSMPSLTGGVAAPTHAPTTMYQPYAYPAALVHPIPLVMPMPMHPQVGQVGQMGPSVMDRMTMTSPVPSTAGFYATMDAPGTNPMNYGAGFPPLVRSPSPGGEAAHHRNPSVGAVAPEQDQRNQQSAFGKPPPPNSYQNATSTAASTSTRSHWVAGVTPTTENDAGGRSGVGLLPPTPSHQVAGGQFGEVQSNAGAGTTSERVDSGQEEEEEEEVRENLRKMAEGGTAERTIMAKRLYTWGQSKFGQLGHGNTESCAVPRFVRSLSHASIAAVACGYDFTIALSEEGELYSWGRNNKGQLGLGDLQDRWNPEKVTTLVGQFMKAVAAGYAHAATISGMGGVFTWGDPALGRLGLESKMPPPVTQPKRGQKLNKPAPPPEPQTYPQQIAFKRKNVKHVACGYDYTLFLTNDGDVYSCGANDRGQLGHGDNVAQWVPKLIAALRNEKIKDISTGVSSVMAVTERGQIFVWGTGHLSSLFKTIASGMGSSVPKEAFETLSAPSELKLPSKKAVAVKKVVCGKEAHACLSEDGQLLTWGNGAFGQLGHGGLNNQSTPKRVDALSKETIKHFAFGAHHAAALSITGELFMWGKNSGGQLGVEGKTKHCAKPQLVPYFTETGMSLSSVSCGGAHTAGIYDYWSDTMLRAWQGRLHADEVRKLQRYLVSQPWLSVQPLFDTLEATSSIQASSSGDEEKAGFWSNWKVFSAAPSTTKADRPIIKLSKHLVNFEKAKQRVMNVPILDEFTIKNVGRVPADWAVVAPHNPTYELEFEPHSGTLQKDQETVVKVILLFKLETSVDIAVTINVTGGQRHFLLLRAQGEAPGGEQWNVDFDELQLIEQVGKGISASVYKALYRQEIVAVKRWQMDPEMMLTTDLNDFIKEVSLLSTLEEHTNIVRFIGACAKPASLCIVMEFLERGSLFDILKDTSNLFSLERVLQMALDAATGLAFLHDRNIIHRDMKSLNLLVAHDWAVKVADFGVSRVEAPVMTCGLGTMRWMAPEVLRREKYERSSDVFSFGLTLNEMMTRKIPYHDIDNLSVPETILRGGRPTVPGHTPPELAELIRDCWNDNAAMRPTIAMVVHRLKVLLAKASDRTLALGQGSSAHFSE